jgi:Domain of unknown function (DUF4336)
MLEKFADSLWIAARPLRFFGVETGTRMTVVRLSTGDLLVHSPIALDAQTKAEVDALGPVIAIVAPCLFHHLYVGEWALAYPKAAVLGAPGLAKKRQDIRWSRALGDAPEDEWHGELDQVLFSAFALANEVVFFHRASKSIISSDLMFNLRNHPSRLTRTVALLAGQRAPGPTLLERVMIRDHGAAREQIGRMVAWGAERVVLAHGDVIEENGSDVLRRAYAWL